MMVEYDVTIRGVDDCQELRMDVLEQARGLKRFAPDIWRCSVLLESFSRRRGGCGRMTVNVQVALPGARVDVGCASPAGGDTGDSDTAIRDAFRVMRRRLQDLHRRQRGEVCAYQSSTQGRVARLDSESGCGLIDTLDGREVPFHRRSVVDGSFDCLAEGDEVVLTEVQGSRGCRAGTVHRLKRPCLV